MENAIERSQQESLVVFEVDSKLVARQMQSFGLGKFACRSDQLRPLYSVCIGFSRQLDANGVRWYIRHIYIYIYREFNMVADSLANAAVANGDASWAPAH